MDIVLIVGTKSTHFPSLGSAPAFHRSDPHSAGRERNREKESKRELFDE